MVTSNKSLVDIFCDRLKKVAQIELLLLIIIPIFVLLGWQYNIETFKRVLPSLVAMNPLTAICFIGLGIALWLVSHYPVKPISRRYANILGVTVAGLGMGVLSRYLFHVHLSPDTLFFQSKLDVMGQTPNRMAPNTAFCFIISGLVIVLMDVRIRINKYPYQYLSILLGFISLFALIGYLYGINDLVGVGPFIPIALPTAICFLITASIALNNRPKNGLMMLITTDQSAGFLTRRLMAAALIIPIILGYMRVIGQRAGLYDTALGVALFVVTNILIFFIVVWISGGVLYRKELEVVEIKDEFLHLATHQLQTPLTGIKMYLEILQNGSMGTLNKEQLKLLKRTIEINDRESRIVHDLLNVARLDSGRMTLQKELTDLGKLTKTIIKEQKHTITQRKQTIKLHSKPIVVSIDPTSMRMAIENVISNASKYTPNGGKVEIVINRKANYAVIEIKDNGVGIEPQDITKIFTKFTRLDNSLSQQRGGNGLGMYMVKKIIELHNGGITVTSELHKGTQIIIELPTHSYA